jgi:hypothetical protein
VPELPTRMTNFISHMRCYAPPQFNLLWLPNNSICPLFSSPSHQRGEGAVPGVTSWVGSSACARLRLSPRANNVSYNVKGGRRNTSTRTVEPGAPAGG